MDNNKYINGALICYFTPEASRLYCQLTESCNLDPDLAIEVMEKLLKDTEMYELEALADE